MGQCIQRLERIRQNSGGLVMNAREILTKLGMALYLHKAMIKDAQKGKEAVEYLKEKGVFGEGKGRKS